MSSRFGTYVDPTQRGIPQGSTAEEMAAFRAEEADKDTEIDENVEIVEMEKRDFDDVEGIESDME
jgi:hypothetical protein